jgi:transporter family-2 protein
VIAWDGAIRRPQRARRRALTSVGIRGTEAVGVAKIVLSVIAAAAGLAAALQASANSSLARHTGIGAALVVNTSIVLSGALALWACEGAPRTFFPVATPITLYLGGIFGFVIIAAGTFVFPKIGAAHAIALMVAGQCCAALAIDHFGLLGMPRDPVTMRRVVGVGLVAAGIAVLKW